MLYGKTLREAYSFARFIEKTIKENGLDFPDVRERLIEIKRDIRKHVNRKETGWFEGIENNFVNGWNDNGGESCHLKYFFPDEHWMEEEKAEFKDAFWIKAPYSAYDCTGAIFTSFINIFNVPKGTIVYMWMSVDV